MSQPIIVLHQPQLGENIGMCARAMLNCGLDRLRLVAPRNGWPDEAARATAADADRVLEQAEIFESIEAAVADCHRVFATTARPRAREIPAIPVTEAAEEIRESDGSNCAVVFGPEASGLDTEAITRADRLVHFPTNPEFNSLNLAQAVLLLGWEWRRATLGDSAEVDTQPTDTLPAAREELIAFLDRFESALEASGFFLTPELKPDTTANLRAFFSRANPTSRELRMLHGVLTALGSAGRPDQDASPSSSINSEG